MSTKYILVGGYARKAPDGGKAFCDEFVKGFGSNGPVRILDCLFARPKAVWEQTLAEDKDFFVAHLPGKSLEIELADPRSFLEQIAQADCVYLKGGDTPTMKSALLSFGREALQKVFVGKTVAGSSAGTAVLSVADYDLDYFKIDEGLGLVPVKTLCHYRSDYNAPRVDWDKVDSEMEKYREAERIPLFKLREGEYKVF